MNLSLICQALSKDEKKSLMLLAKGQRDNTLRALPVIQDTPEKPMDEGVAPPGGLSLRHSSREKELSNIQEFLYKQVFR